uniref:Uncharacterized protein n=1 Tax=Molossus molossus TaxID=27622 RepID=A0A7J8IZK3_MOLMO|nr:hypothetical protein HJG59_010419 [Molossus molossus]
MHCPQEPAASAEHTPEDPARGRLPEAPSKAACTVTLTLFPGSFSPDAPEHRLPGAPFVSLWISEETERWPEPPRIEVLGQCFLWQDNTWQVLNGDRDPPSRALRGQARATAPPCPRGVGGLRALPFPGPTTQTRGGACPWGGGGRAVLKTSARYLGKAEGH